MTKKLMQDRITEDQTTDWGPGVENTRIITMAEPRMKRTAISAAPLSSMADMEGDLIKIPKPSV
jgi:predicted AlkP superfamily phosphohydrolase/phosphomutase